MEKTAPTFNVDIHMAGDIRFAANTLQRWAIHKGMCVSLTPQTFIYTGGREEGFKVGLINYPRFPAEPSEILKLATVLAEALVFDLGQHSYSIVTPTETIWRSSRDEAPSPVNAELLAVAEMMAGLKDEDGKRTPTNEEIDAARRAIEKAKVKGTASSPTEGEL